MTRKTTHVVIFGGHSIGQIQATTTQEAGDKASALAMDHLTDLFGAACTQPGINRIAQRCAVLDAVEKAIGDAATFDVTHAPPGMVQITAKGSKNTWPYCYVELRRRDQQSKPSENVAR